jgi:hypothetical protein
MATGKQVLEMLRPDGGWVIVGDDFQSIQFISCDPITQEDFVAGFAQYDVWKASQKAEAEAKRQALLARLNITEEEAKLLLS